MKRSNTAALVVAAALALTLAGCSTAGGSTPTSSDATIDNSIGKQFSGGTPGSKASKEPITIGLVNQEGGTVSDPEVSAAVKAAFDYINAEQGGVDGHPLTMQLCKITSSDEEAQQCAQQFLNDSKINVIMQGGLNTGSDAVHQVINGAKPTVITLANPGSDATAKNAYAVNPSVIAALPGIAGYSKQHHYETLSIITDSNPGNTYIAQLANQIFTGAGFKTKVTTFPAGSTDLTGPFTAATIDKPDALVPIIVSSAGCIAMGTALKSIGNTTPVMAAGLCASDELKKALGDFPEWNYGSTNLLPYAPDKTGQYAFYQAVMHKYAGADASLGLGAPGAFGAAFFVAKSLNSLKGAPVTAASAASAFKSYTDGIVIGVPKVAFGSVPNMPTLSGVAQLFYTYKGGKWTNSGWIGLPQ